MRTRRRILVVLASIALIFGVAACGGGGDDDDGVASLDGSDGETAAADDDDGGGGGGPRGVDETAFRDAMLEYTECMRDHGIDMPDPQFEGGGGVIIRGGPGEEGGIDPQSEEFQAAEEECRPLMEDALPDLDLDPEEQAEMQDRMLDFAQCMRDKGHDFPDPVFSDDGGPSINVGPGGGGGRGPAGDFDDPAFQEDLEDCREESGGGGFFGGSVSEDEDE